MNNIRDHAKENVPIILLGNKADLAQSRQVSI
jgi:GTPase SAR1 family protein